MRHLDFVSRLPDPHTVPLEQTADLQQAVNALCAYNAVITRRKVEAASVDAVREATGLTKTNVRRQAKLGAALETLEQLQRAALSGKVDADTATIIGKHPDAETALLKTATTLGADALRKHVAQMRRHTTRDEANAEKNRGLHIGELRDGLVRISGRLTPQVASLLKQGTDALVIKSKADYPAQRRHDALGVLLSRAAMPTRGGAPITITYQVTADGQGYLGDIAVSAETIRQAHCGADISHLTRAPNGRIIALEHNGRLFNHHQRRAITVRDGGCVIPGCEVPSEWCEVHHVRPYSHGGPTSTDNGALLCGSHHKSVHMGRWEVTMRDGMPRVRPGGTSNRDGLAPVHAGFHTTRHESPPSEAPP